jgi:hypothetical protein
MQLIHILDHQLEILINEGKPDFPVFLISLKEESLISAEKYKELSTYFTLNMVNQYQKKEFAN